VVPVVLVDGPPPPHPTIVPNATASKTDPSPQATTLRRLPANSSSETPIDKPSAIRPPPKGECKDNPPLALPGAVVETVTITDVAELPVTFTVAGTLQTGAGDTFGVTAQVKFTVPVNDPVGVSARLNVAVWPAGMVDELDPPDGTPSVKLGAATPVPAIAIVCDPLPALSATTRFAAAAPAAVGVNVTLIVQVASGCTVAQLFVCVNPPALAPLIDTPETVSATAPLLLSTIGEELLLLPTVCEGKVNDAGAKLAPGTDTVVLTRTKMAFAFASRTIKSGFPSPFMSTACSISTERVWGVAPFGGSTAM